MSLGLVPVPKHPSPPTPLLPPPYFRTREACHKEGPGYLFPYFRTREACHKEGPGYLYQLCGDLSHLNLESAYYPALSASHKEERQKKSEGKAKA